MQSPLEIIESYGAPTNSYIAAVTYLRHERRPMSKDEHEQGITDIIGTLVMPHFSNEKEAEIYFMYSVQETIRAYNTGVIPDMAEVWEEVLRRAKHFIAENPWSIKMYESDIVVVAEDGSTSTKKKKGAKKLEAESIYHRMNDGTNDRNAIVAAFMDELEMSKAGATTYFHNLRKQFDFSGPKTEKPKRQRKVRSPAKGPDHKQIAKRKKGPSKGKMAKDIYASMPGADKADVIARIIAETGTSKAGANTYYCAARKEME